MQDQSLLQQVTMVMYLPILQYAYLLEQTYGQYFVDPPEGIYLPGSVDPIITQSSRCYTMGEDRVARPIEDINTVTTDVTDYYGKVIIPAAIMKEKEKRLSPTPNLPTVAIHVIKLMVERFIISKNPYKNTTYFDNKILSKIKDGYEDIFIGERIDQLLTSLFEQVAHFMDIDLYHLYFVKLQGVDLVIEKTVDFRVLDWERRRELGEISIEDCAY